MSETFHDLKPCLEEETNSVLSLLPAARIELDRPTVARGENLAGYLCISAGRKELWLDSVDLVVAGVARTSSSLHSSTTVPVARLIQVPARLSRRLPLLIPIPVDTKLGQKQIMLQTGGIGAYETFVVEPEAHFGRLAEDFAAQLGLAVASWSASQFGGVYAQLTEPSEKRSRFSGIGLEMVSSEEMIQGELIVDAPSHSRAVFLRAMLKSSRSRIPFSVPLADPEIAASELLRLLRSHHNGERNLPLPVAAADAPEVDQLPLPHGSVGHD